MIAESDAAEGVVADATVEAETAAPAVVEEVAAVEEPTAPKAPNRAFELLERARQEQAKRKTEVSAKRAAAAPAQVPAPVKPANAMQALEAGGFSIDDIIRESIAASDQAAADKGKPAPALDQDKLLAAIQERVPQLVEQRVQQVFEAMQRAQIEQQENARALEMHEAVQGHVASAAAKLPALAEAAKRDAVAVTEAMVNVYDSVLKATGKRLTMEQAARRLNAILVGDDETIVAAAPNARSTSTAGKPAPAKPSPVDRRELSWEDEEKAAHQEALDILAGKIPVPK